MVPNVQNLAVRLAHRGRRVVLLFAAVRIRERGFRNAPQGQELIPSNLSLDVDGRVLRMNSLSKILASGARIGWVTASHRVIQKFVRQNETSSQHPSGFF
ncbi:hypothetical protein N7532_005569 [Penicillium argentinense]|uniref:Uncharacterized protein n=1 Tax=Penicillium argentinense TaxID=1131581 RepID=A0A9W9FE52_9EURO|nr:uncharacterized protein N7532_005569 [Penicillium argentinense]KAJ5098568.1 hypothetical protein N7532_005569 [Penicillium argentinense]